MYYEKNKLENVWNGGTPCKSGMLCKSIEFQLYNIIVVRMAYPDIISRIIRGLEKTEG